jgi:hypothetical protein
LEDVSLDSYPIGGNIKMRKTVLMDGYYFLGNLLTFVGEEGILTVCKFLV